MRPRNDTENLVRFPFGLRHVGRSRLACAQEDAGHHPEYPIERVGTHLYAPFQLTFARHAEQLLCECDDVWPVPSHQGLRIRAETEEAICGAVEILQDFYGTQIRLGPVTIRYHDAGATLEEPWMGLRIQCAPEHFAAVRADLMARRATIVTAELHSAVTVIQATAPLAQLIGYASVLSKLTSATAQRTTWLSHYAPMEEPPPGGTAA